METPRALAQGALSGASTTLTSSVSAPVNVRSERGVEKLMKVAIVVTVLIAPHPIVWSRRSPILGPKCTVIVKKRQPLKESLLTEKPPPRLK